MADLVVTQTMQENVLEHEQKWILMRAIMTHVNINEGNNVFVVRSVDGRGDSDDARERVGTWTEMNTNEGNNDTCEY